MKQYLQELSGHRGTAAIFGLLLLACTWLLAAQDLIAKSSIWSQLQSGVYHHPASFVCFTLVFGYKLAGARIWGKALGRRILDVLFWALTVLLAVVSTLRGLEWLRGEPFATFSVLFGSIGPGPYTSFLTLFLLFLLHVGAELSQRASRPTWLWLSYVTIVIPAMLAALQLGNLANDSAYQTLPGVSALSGSMLLALAFFSLTGKKIWALLFDSRSPTLSTISAVTLTGCLVLAFGVSWVPISHRVDTLLISLLVLALPGMHSWYRSRATFRYQEKSDVEQSMVPRSAAKWLLPSAPARDPLMRWLHHWTFVAPVWQQQFWQALWTFVLATGAIGLSRSEYGPVAVIWLANGYLAYCLLTQALARWLSTLLLFNLALLVANLMFGFSLVQAVLMGLTNSLEGFFIALALRVPLSLRLHQRHLILRPHQLKGLIPVVGLVLLVPLIVAPIGGGVLTIFFNGHLGDNTADWATGSLLGGAIIAPFVMSCLIELHAGYKRLRSHLPDHLATRVVYGLAVAAWYLWVEPQGIQKAHIIYILFLTPLFYLSSLSRAAPLFALTTLFYLSFGHRLGAADDAFEMVFTVVGMTLALCTCYIARLLVEVRESEFDAALELTPTGVLTLDERGRILAASHNVRHWLEIDEFNPSDHWLPACFEERDAIHQLWHDAFTATPQEQITARVHRTLQSGVHMTFRLTIKGLNDPTHSAAYLVALKDITAEAAAQKAYDDLIDNNHSIILIQGKDWIIHRCSRAWTEATGYNRQETVGKDFLVFVEPEDQAKVQRLRQHFLVGPELDSENNPRLRIVTKSGGMLTVIMKRVAQDNHHQQPSIVLTLIDISALESEQKKLQAALDNTRIYLDAGLGAIALNNEHHQLIYCSQAFMNLCGYASKEDAKPPETFYLSESYPEYLKIRRQLEQLETGQVYVHPVLLKAHGPQGRVLALRRSARWFEVPGEKGRVQMIMFEDMTPLAEVQEQLTFLVERDEMTGLFSRRGMLTQVSAMEQSELAVFVLDLDYFKSVNDCYGHEAGDALLRAVGKTLEQAVKPQGCAVRLGGEEFALILPWTNWEHMATYAENLREAVAQTPAQVYGQTVRRTVSIGFSHKKMSDSLSAALHLADLAQREAKQTGRNKAIAATDDLHKQLAKRGAFIASSDVQMALMAGEIFYAVQPIWNCLEKRIEGFEALIRWQTSNGLIVMPVQFIDVLKEVIRDPAFMAIITQLRTQVLKKLSDFPDVYVAFNITLEELAFDGAADMLHNQFSTARDHPKRPIVLELSESALHGRVEEQVVVKELQTLNRLGYLIALDDFGVEASNINRLQNFPIDILKLDKALIGAIVTSQIQRKTVFTLAQLVKALKIKVVVEGVETVTQANVLSTMGLHLHQGYVHARPMRAEDIQTNLPSIGADLKKSHRLSSSERAHFIGEQLTE